MENELEFSGRKPYLIEVIIQSTNEDINVILNKIELDSLKEYCDKYDIPARANRAQVQSEIKKKLSALDSVSKSQKKAKRIKFKKEKFFEE
jgi:H2-forming N5,N10-methylenetetrahydromethanopterin dehydrogenase-like enzyme